MSGGGGNEGVGPSPPGGPPDCRSLDIETSLTGPDPDVVAGLQVGDALDIELLTTDGRRRVVALRHGEIAGAIVTHLTALLRCLQDGFEFSGSVVEVDDGNVRLRVRAVT